ncbi:asparaginyl-tRNA synthetase [Lojkania enalia]|uniref:asparagine--tRNA ligase n=1 Tax=Lojkania enalia TaxID=147567 RepID=A0A9P4KIY8_9PLEO|nr:asparaginyl-tRNA synthetase [Didymosphaeria enalia]
MRGATYRQNGKLHLQQKQDFPNPPPPRSTRSFPPTVLRPALARRCCPQVNLGMISTRFLLRERFRLPQSLPASLLPPCRPANPAATLHPYAPPWSCLARCNSTLASPNIATLLRESLPSSTQGPLPSGETLTVNGYVRTVRKQKRIAFAALGDGSSLQPVQVVLTPEQANGLSTGVAVAVTGQWKPSPGQGQCYELQAQSVRILGDNDAATYPIQKKYHTPEFLRSLPHLRSRLPFHSLLLRLRSQVTAQLTDYFSSHDFVQVHPPIITSSDCEGAGEVFIVSPETSPSHSTRAPGQPQGQNDSFFGTPKYLTVSGQLHLEALAQSVNKVWTLSPTFRAEKSDTPRHLSEFYMLETELAFIEDLGDVMDVVEGMLRAVASHLQASRLGQELLDVRARDPIEGVMTTTQATLAERWQGLVNRPWPRIAYSDAMKHLKGAVTHGKAHFEFLPDDKNGLQTEHERFLAEAVGQGGPIFITDYPRSIKPFYMAPSANSSSNAQTAPTVACFDLLVPELCELVGGSMREHRLPELLKSMEDHGLQRAFVSGSEAQASNGSLQWYLDLRRYGSVPHGGFGLGFDRLLCYLSGVANIRDVVSFPRCYESLPPNFSLTSNMIAGAFAGIAEHSVMYPIDLLKTRMQVVNPTPTAVYSGISNAMITISRAEGFRTLWRGLSSVVLGAGPAHAVYFASYEAVKHALGGNEGGKDEHHPVAAAASGAAATIASDALMNPFDGKSNPLVSALPFTALQFMAYESISKVMNPTGRYDPYTHCTAGGLAGGFAAGLTTPLDVIKTTLQTRGNAADPELRNVSGLWEAAKIIKRRNGYRGYFRGLKPRIITTMPSTAICWSAYEMAKAFFIARGETP